MKSLKQIKRIAAKVTGNYVGQAALDKLIYYTQNLMGIGRGNTVRDSGEVGVIRLVGQRYANRSSQAELLRVFDVGANKGQFLSLLLDNLGHLPLEVHSFEPGAAAYVVLQERYGSDERVQLNHCGLGSKAETLTLRYPTPGSVYSTLIEHHTSHWRYELALSEAVQITTLDDYCHERGVEHIDLLKIDVEGFEMDVLEGGHDMLRKQAFDIVLFEFGPSQVERRHFFYDFYRFFEEAGMRLHRVSPSGYLYPIGDYDERLEQFRVSNYAAIACR